MLTTYAGLIHILQTWAYKGIKEVIPTGYAMLQSQVFYFTLADIRQGGVYCVFVSDIQYFIPVCVSKQKEVSDLNAFDCGKNMCTCLKKGFMGPSIPSVHDNESLAVQYTMHLCTYTYMVLTDIQCYSHMMWQNSGNK